MANRHVYILDTCVLLHDPQAIYKFANNDLYIPLAVIDDLDEIKTRREPVGWAAREVFRQMDRFDLKEMVDKGVVVNEAGGKLHVYNGDAPLSKGEMPSISRVNSDNALIATCAVLKSKNPRRKVAIVTKDVGLRVRAQSLGCMAENYMADMYSDTPYDGTVVATVDCNEDWQYLHSVDCVDVARLSARLAAQVKNICPNEFVFFQWGDSILPTWNHVGGLMVVKDKGGRKPEYSGVKPHNLEQRCALEALADPAIPLVILTGAAGTGKTLCTLAVALQQINDGEYDKIVVIKPTVPVGGADIGALPGDKFEKLSAWLGPIKDNVLQLTGEQTKGNKKPPGYSFEELVNQNIIEVEGLTFIQGRSFTNCIIIVDELQNVTPRVARMVVERCGNNSKVVLLGDMSQVENPYLDHNSCGLRHAVEGARESKLAVVVGLKKVERSPLASEAPRIFDRPEAYR